MRKMIKQLFKKYHGQTQIYVNDTIGKTIAHLFAMFADYKSSDVYDDKRTFYIHYDNKRNSWLRIDVMSYEEYDVMTVCDMGEKSFKKNHLHIICVHETSKTQHNSGFSLINDFMNYITTNAEVVKQMCNDGVYNKYILNNIPALLRGVIVDKKIIKLYNPDFDILSDYFTNEKREKIVKILQGKIKNESHLNYEKKETSERTVRDFVRVYCLAAKYLTLDENNKISDNMTDEEKLEFYKNTNIWACTRNLSLDENWEVIKNGSHSQQVCNRFHIGFDEYDNLVLWMHYKYDFSDFIRVLETLYDNGYAFNITPQERRRIIDTLMDEDLILLSDTQDNVSPLLETYYWSYFITPDIKHRQEIISQGYKKSPKLLLKNKC